LQPQVEDFQGSQQLLGGSVDSNAVDDVVVGWCTRAWKVLWLAGENSIPISGGLGFLTSTTLYLASRWYFVQPNDDQLEGICSKVGEGSTSFPFCIE
jgi:hypothetical protein